MMSELRDLYQDMILDHNKRPRNRGKLDGANHKAEGFNPLCGDRVTVYVKTENDVVVDVSFEGSGCAISTASASMMTDAVKGKTLDQARQLFQRFRALVTEDDETQGDPGSMGKLAVFSGVGQFPARVKCATLAWHTVNAALNDEAKPVSTE